MNYLDYCETEKLLKIYYENKEKVRLKETYLKKLENSLKKIQDNLIDASIVLHTDLKGINYDKISVKGGQLPCSDMERQIENVFSSLEGEKENIENEIVLINTEILMINNKNRAMESIIDLVSDENREFIKLRYQDKFSLEKIADISHVSKTAIKRKLEFILSDIMKFNRYLEGNRKSGTKTFQKRYESGTKAVRKRYESGTKTFQN